jgi:RHS repeat-associated protein
LTSLLVFYLSEKRSRHSPTLTNLAVNTSNRITLAGFTYDAAGNETSDVTNTYVWNAESEIKTAGGLNYTYDGDGDRVQKSNGKIYWYGAGSQVLDESDAAGNITDEYIYFGGKRIAHQVVSTSALNYYVEDMLGSSRALATSTGTLCYDADFYPYGGEHDYVNTCAQNYKFTGKERDPETNNDDFDARYYSSAYGRFLSADWSSTPTPVPYANLTNPQTLNLYAMVSDNPESFADLDGHKVELQSNTVACAAGGSESCEAQEAAAQNSGTAQTQTAQNSDPTAPPPPPTPDPAGVRTEPALNPSNPNPSTTNTPADQTQAPMESRGQQPKGERNTTSKPEFKDKPGKLPKGVKPNPDKPGEFLVKDPHTGNWKPKPPGWSPYAQQIGIGAAIVTGAVITGHAIAGCFASGACEAGLVFAF